MKTLLLIPAVLLLSCTKPDWKSPATYAEGTLVNSAVTAVAQHYGGDKAGHLAANGLHATAEVLQGYIDKKPPLDIVAQSPGVQGMGKVLVNWLKDKGYVTQSTVDSIHKAAAIAANLTQSNHVVPDSPRLYDNKNGWNHGPDSPEKPNPVYPNNTNPYSGKPL